MSDWEVSPPTEEQIRLAAEHHRLELSEEEIKLFTEMISERMEAYQQLAALIQNEISVQINGRNVHTYTENKKDNNTFITRCHLEGRETGQLDDLSLAIKDNIQVAGIEMTCGSKALSGYVPDADADVVSLLLNAGVTIIGKTNMDSWAVSGTGELTDYGPIYNPNDSDYLAGGSSGGSAVAVVEESADIAIGTDQAGSIRVPAAWSGCVGLKPSFGLVPYTGCVGLGYIFDHVGILARNVETVADVLDVVAVKTGTDPRQSVVPDIQYSDSIPTDDSVKIGILSEGFIGEDDKVDTLVRNRLNGFAGDTIDITDVSIPMHRYGGLIWQGIANETTAAVFDSEGVGHYQRGEYNINWADKFAAVRRDKTNNLPPTIKLTLLTGQYMRDEYRGMFHAASQNLSAILSERYDQALDRVDVLAMPTTPVTAFKHIQSLEKKDRIKHAQGKQIRGTNTMPFNTTGHPAISVPCGYVDNLPVGVTFVGSRNDDKKVLDISSRFEKMI
jgi:amidase